jgi:hypothetical protein
VTYPATPFQVIRTRDHGQMLGPLCLASRSRISPSKGDVLGHGLGLLDPAAPAQLHQLVHRHDDEHIDGSRDGQEVEGRLQHESDTYLTRGRSIRE